MLKILFKFWKPFLAVIFWGISFVATKIALKELDPKTIITLRLLLGVVFILIIAMLTPNNFKVTKKNLSAIIILAFIAVFHLWIQITGLKFTSAVNTGWIIGISPVFIAIFGFLFFKEKMTLTNILGMLIAFFGLLLLIGKGNPFRIGFVSHLGDLLVVASTITWAIYSIVNKKISLNFSPMMTILYLFAAMLIIILPFTINANDISAVAHLSIKGLIAILFLGIFCTGMAYVLWSQSLNELDASKVGAFLYVEPFVTVFSSWLILNETIGIITILSGVIILVGVMLVNHSK